MQKTIVVIVIFFTNYVFGQDFIPSKDTVILKDKIKIEYKVQKHAVFMTTYQDGKRNGLCKSYYISGKLWSESNNRDGKIDGQSISYTPNGEVAVIEEWKSGMLKSKKIFYQNTFSEPQKYYFVSKDGFDLIKNGVAVKLNNTTPDSLIEENPFGSYMWIKGEKKLFSGKEAPKYKLIKTGDKPGYYMIDSDGKETFIRALTKEEMKY